MSLEGILYSSPSFGLAKMKFTQMSKVKLW